MGRKKKEKVGSFDRIGEEVNLEKCPECVEHPDCFAWMDGRCTALKESGGRGCVFYCSAEKAIAEARVCFRKLMEQHRTDLIQKYFKSLSALGLLDEEIDAVCRAVDQLSDQMPEQSVDLAGDAQCDAGGEEGTDGADDRCRDPVGY